MAFTFFYFFFFFYRQRYRTGFSDLPFLSISHRFLTPASGVIRPDYSMYSITSRMPGDRSQFFFFDKDFDFVDLCCRCWFNCFFRLRTRNDECFPLEVKILLSVIQPVRKVSLQFRKFITKSSEKTDEWKLLRNETYVFKFSRLL